MYRRKRKRYTNSLSPRESPEIQPSPSYNHQGSHAVQVQEYNSRPAKSLEAYRARDRYLGRHVSFDEAIASRYPKDQGSRLTSADLQLLTHQGAFQLPPKPVQDEFISAYMEYCSPWTPIVETSWLQSQSVSYLLLQSILLAASRVVRQRSDTQWTSADFYRRAKLLFFFGHEQDPLISMVSAVLLHWYNPVGPETISTDTSGFWLRTAESIAFQVGLHKEPARHDRNRALKRRLWWTLVVSHDQSVVKQNGVCFANKSRSVTVLFLLVSGGLGPSISLTAMCCLYLWMTFMYTTTRNPVYFLSMLRYASF